MRKLNYAPHTVLVQRASLLFCALVLALLPACAPPASEIQAGPVTVIVQVDGKQLSVSLPAGSTVQHALDAAGIMLNPLDQITPPTYTSLFGSETIQVNRVREVFENEEVVVPFARQTIRNESLPEGQTLLIQPGVNGLQQITYRRVYENELEGPRIVFKVVTLEEARPEIVMVGVQAPFTAVAIPGTLVYLTAGNAWVMEGTTGERRPLVTTGDLDGRVFSISPDRSWLLYTRKAQEGEGDEDQAINRLWAAEISGEGAEPVDLEVENIIHFADWADGPGLSVVYSTVEPRTTAPGWQANNDLHLLTFTSSGIITRDEELVEANFGGIYGWWGINYAWSSDGKQLAYARPDGIGLVDLKEGTFSSLIDILPYQTRGDWAWAPGIAWAPDDSALYLVNHIPMSGQETDESSPLFDVTALLTGETQALSLAPQTGMFAYPAPSGLLPDGSFRVAYLQAATPEKSESSRYRLVVMDRDGSNQRPVFPPEGSPGLEPQQVSWSPLSEGAQELWLAVVYQGNLWLVQPETMQSQQITGDGSIGKVDWK